jgi:plasmid stabilization system protein ParE
MAFQVKITSQAQVEVLGTFVWKSENQSVAAATAWYNDLMTQVYTLADMPERCALAPESDHFEDEIRQLLVNKRRQIYRVLFTIRRDTVYILHILNSAMDTLRPGE